MSAYVVSREHIDALVAAGMSRVHGSTHSWYHEGEWHKLDSSNADQVGAMLWSENIASVGYRYSPPGREAIYGEGWDTPDESLPGTYQLETIAPGVAPVETPEWSTEYRFNLRSMLSKQRSAVEILKLIDCYEYQSCEHSEWEESEAFAFCKYLRDRTIGTLPGYDDAPWGL